MAEERAEFGRMRGRRSGQFGERPAPWEADTRPHHSPPPYRGPEHERSLSPLALLLGIGIDRPAVRRAALRAASNVVRVTRRGISDVLDVAYRSSADRSTRYPLADGIPTRSSRQWEAPPSSRELVIRGPAGSLAVGQFSLSRDAGSETVIVTFAASDVVDPSTGLTRPESLQIHPGSGECAPQGTLVVTVGLEVPVTAEAGSTYGVSRVRATAPGYEQELLVSIFVEDF